MNLYESEAPMRVAVTGGAGFVGSHVAQLLSGLGHRVLAIDSLTTGRPENVPACVDLAVEDICEPGVWQLLRRFRPDAIVHLAAQASVPVSVQQPQLDARVNVLGGINLGQAALAAGVECFVYVNTGGALYGHPRYLPVDEDHPVEPISPYGLSKWTAEQYLRMLLTGHMGVKVLRLANVYGPRQSLESEAGVVTVFASRMLAGQTVAIHGDGEQTRDFVYVGDVADACLRALRAPGDLGANISSGIGTTVNALFALCAAATGYDQQPQFLAARPGDIRHSVLSNHRAFEQLGWKPAVDLQEGLAQTLAWLTGHEEVSHEALAGRPV
jgi:UDP-glucose 4-epimerase